LFERTEGGTSAHVPPAISICIVSRHRPRELDACLESLQQQISAPTYEVLVSGNGDPGAVDTVLRRFPEAIVVIGERDHPGAARNRVIEHASGEILLFLDDDVVADPHLLWRLTDLAEHHPEHGVFGGPNLNPPDSSRFQALSGGVLASLVASGPVRRRYGEHPPGSADERYFILCNLAVRRAAMVPFANDLAGGEENQVLVDLARAGLSMYYDPSLIVYHARRHTMRGFVRQMFKYGFGRGQVIARDPASVRLAYLVPSALLLYLAVLIPLSLFQPWALVPFGLYLGAVVASALKVALTLGEARAAPLGVAMTIAVHVSYGSGVVAGSFSKRQGMPGPEGAQRQASDRSEAVERAAG
jgi:GT2 family glycosyltransferase